MDMKVGFSTLRRKTQTKGVKGQDGVFVARREEVTEGWRK
jgi:hypothetical protein